MQSFAVPLTVLHETKTSVTVAAEQALLLVVVELPGELELPGDVELPCEFERLSDPLGLGPGVGLWSGPIVIGGYGGKTQTPVGKSG